MKYIIEIGAFDTQVVQGVVQLVIPNGGNIFYEVSENGTCILIMRIY